MKVYRIAKKEYINDLSGTGSRIYGGRWNKKGTGIVYTAENRSLATIETLVHVSLNILPVSLSIATINITDEVSLKKINIEHLPKNWNLYPAPVELAIIGTNWVKENKYLVLKVPSIIVNEEYNYLINPLHKEFKKIKIIEIKDYSMDKRLI